MKLRYESSLAWAQELGGYKGKNTVEKTDKDAKKALARVAKLSKKVPEGPSKLRHDTGSGH